jgi:tRNA (guanine37-N1)-methyltransferase
MRKLKFNIITLFPDFFTSSLKSSLTGKAIEKQILEVNVIYLRDFAINRHGQVDDSPYGGGSGMVLMAEPLKKALDSIPEKTHKILLSPRGYLWTQEKCHSLFHQNNYDSISLICGHYEGFDERIVKYVDDSICIGDFVLSGGEPAALVLIDSLSRLLPGFMGNSESIVDESFHKPGYLEYPQYTRPVAFEGDVVPEVLLSGNHGKIQEWREAQSKQAFLKFR